MSENLLKKWLFVSLGMKSSDIWMYTMLYTTLTESWNFLALFTFQIRACCVFFSSSLHIFVLFSIPCHQIFLYVYKNVDDTQLYVFKFLASRVYFSKICNSLYRLYILVKNPWLVSLMWTISLLYLCLYYIITCKVLLLANPLWQCLALRGINQNESPFSNLLRFLNSNKWEILL